MQQLMQNMLHANIACGSTWRKLRGEGSGPIREPYAWVAYRTERKLREGPSAVKISMQPIEPSIWGSGSRFRYTWIRPFQPRNLRCSFSDSAS
jgi:hypothetical protein